jgi:hypothetical protein
MEMDGAYVVAKRASLSTFTAEKPGAASSIESSKTAEKEKPRGQTLRLSPEAWRQLKMLAVERGTTSHALLIEAVNSLFQKHGKPPIA